MRCRPESSLVLFVLVLAVVPLGFSPGAEAAHVACDAADVSDEANDLAYRPANSTQADAVTGFDQLDLKKLCIAETATATHLLIEVRGDVATQATRTFHWYLNFTADGTAVRFHLKNEGTTTTVEPAEQGFFHAKNVQFNLSRADYPSGTLIDQVKLETNGTFAPQVGQAVGASDRAPNGAAVANLNYVIGKRAPAGVDSDQDGAEDAAEVAAGSDPRRVDTDEDGLLDGATRELNATDSLVTVFTRAGILQRSGTGGKTQFVGEKSLNTNASRPDSDGDGLLDGANVPAGGSRGANLTSRGFTAVTIPGDPGALVFLGELSFCTPQGSATNCGNPTASDTDNDGLPDGEEANGARNRGNNADYGRRAYYPHFEGSTDLSQGDTDGDTLTDGEEVSGSAVINGVSRTFTPTDPNRADTDGDDLSDLEELQGRADTKAGPVTFTPTDPTKQDTDGDGVDDGQEVSQGTSPQDPGDHPAINDARDVITYLLISAVALLAVILASTGGILWRWG